MNHDRAHELWTKYLAEGVLLPEEEQELVAAFRRDPVLSEQLLGDVEIDGLLRTLPDNPAEAEASARRFLDCVSAESDTDRFVGQVFDKIQADPPRSAPRPPRQATHRATRRQAPAAAPFPWRELAIAAGVLVAIGALYFILSPSAPAPVKRPVEVVRPPQPRETPEPEIRVPEVPVEPEKPVLPPEPDPVPAPAPVPATPSAPMPAPVPKPAPVPEKPAEKVEPPAPKTVTAVAVLDKVEGEVLIGRVAAKAGDGIPAGESIETAAARSLAVLKFGDGTRLDLGAGTLIKEIADRQAASLVESRPARGRRVTLLRGSLAAEVPKQPADQPMLFVTPHAEARVLGTSLKLDVAKTTRLEVREGKVRFTRADGKKVDVAPGQFAAAGPGADFVARLLAQERRVLLSWDFEGANAAAEWEKGTLDRTQTHGGSRGSLKALFRPDEDYAVHAALVTSPRGPTFTITEKTKISFAYYLSAPAELKVQFRGERNNPSPKVIGYVIPQAAAREWTVVTVRLVDVFLTRAGIGEPIKPGLTDVDDLQFHAGADRKPVDLFIDNIVIFE